MSVRATPRDPPEPCTSSISARSTPELSDGFSVRWRTSLHSEVEDQRMDSPLARSVRDALMEEPEAT